MYFLDYVWSNWIIVAFLAPFFWALVNIIDVYFVSSVYEDEWDGIIINSVFQSLPLLLPLLGIVTFVFPGILPSVLAFTGGALLVISFFFYFKTLFISSDVVVVQAFWNLSVPLVPFFAWLLIGEKLTFVNYVGIALAFIGAMLFTLHKKIKERRLGKVFAVMIGAIVFFSLSMVVQAEAFRLMDGDFWSGFLIFSLGASVTGLFLLFFDPQPLKLRMSHVIKMSKTYFGVFVLAESLNLLGVAASQRAIDLSPAVSFVAVIGSSIPVFVMFLSFVLVIVFIALNKERAREIYQSQLVAFKTKIAACCIIATGIYLIS